MNFYENLRTFDTTNFSEESLTQTCDNAEELSSEMYQSMGVKKPKSSRPQVAILLADNYGSAEGGCDDCPGISIQISMILARWAGYRIKRISNATQLDDCDLLVLPQACFDLPQHFFLTSITKAVKFSLEAEVFARCIVGAVNKGIPILAIGNSAFLLAGMGGLKLCRREDIETPFDHENMKHAIEVAKDSPFYELNNVKVNSQHSAFVAPPKVQREELRLGADEALPFWAFARDGMPEGIGDFEHGIIGVSWLPNFYEQEKQMLLLAWLCEKAEEK